MFDVVLFVLPFALIFFLVGVSSALRRHRTSPGRVPGVSADDAPLLLHFDHSPRAVLAAITNLRRHRAEVHATLGATGRITNGLVFGGILLFLLDRAFGYPSRIFSLAGAGMFMVGLWAKVRVRKARNQPTFEHADLDVAKRVIHTLRDDVAPDRNVHGTIDLRGPGGNDKRSRTAQDARGRDVSYYRDDWLSIKTKLYDGSMLRFAVIRRMKVRDEYWKRGRVSGKMKLKPAVVKADTRTIDIRVSANPELYTLSRGTAPKIGQVVGAYTIDTVAIDGGLLRVTASSTAEATAQDILELLRTSYATLARRAAA